MSTTTTTTSSSSSLFIFFILLSTALTHSHSREFLVGGNANAWSIPSPTSQTLNQWAESTRFQVGDSLVWQLEGKKDSVLQVTREAYSGCNTSSPIEDSGDQTNVVVKLGRSGPYYFVSGESGACERGEKLAVVVMAERRKKSGSGVTPRAHFIYLKRPGRVIFFSFTCLFNLAAQIPFNH